MDKVQQHTLVLTVENALIYVKYDQELSHVEVYQEFYKMGIEIKDCFIQVGDAYNLVALLLKAVNKWVVKNFDEDVEQSSISLKNHSYKNHNIIMELHGRTESGKPFSIKPSELLSPKINFFTDFC
jgi:hypothetical protein